MRPRLLASVVLLSALAACHSKSPAGHHTNPGNEATSATQVVAGSGRLQAGTLTLEVQVGDTTLGGGAQGGSLVLDGATAVQR